MDVNQINWAEIAAKVPKDHDTRLQTGPLPEREYWILKAATAAMKRRLTQNGQSLLVAQVRRHSPEWFENIKFMADQQGLSFEEMFIRLALGEE